MDCILDVRLKTEQQFSRAVPPPPSPLPVSESSMTAKELAEEGGAAGPRREPAQLAAQASRSAMSSSSSSCFFLAKRIQGSMFISHQVNYEMFFFLKRCFREDVSYLVWMEEMWMVRWAEEHPLLL